MKPLLLAVVLVFALAASVRGDAPPAPAADPAAALLEQIRALTAARSSLLGDATVRVLPSARRQALLAAGGEFTAALAEKFLRDHAQDPRRWEAVTAWLAAPRIFEGEDAVARRDDWSRRRAELIVQVLGDRAAPAAALATAVGCEVDTAFQRRTAPDFARAGAALLILAERAPDASMRPMVERLLLDGWNKIDAPAALAHARALASDPNAGIATLAGQWMAAQEFKSRPLDLKFPDLDGREIDLTQYRGRVVLLDFWATWCKPCMEEMPGVRAVLRKYQPQGFEVIGISGDVLAKDPAKPRPGEMTVPGLKEFLARHDMTWPQLWDLRTAGRGPKGLSVQFGVRELPTMLLFDQSGHFVTADVRGPKLEAEVKRLLGL